MVSIHLKTSAFKRQINYKLVCRIFGHRFNKSITDSHHANLCACGERILREVGAETHVRHVLSCFIFGHKYERVEDRDGHYEYACQLCGHPLLIERRESYTDLMVLHIKPNYLCSLFGHNVHKVAERHRLTEYACRCGHSFLKSLNETAKIKHPLVCVFTGHLIRFVKWRNNRAEYMCRDCGHPFYFSIS